VDNVRAVDFLLHKAEIGDIYNISAGSELSNLELTTLILSKCNLDQERIEYVEDRPAHDRRYSLDSSKIRALGWKPLYDFEKSLELTLDWYRENVTWWKKLKKF